MSAIVSRAVRFGLSPWLQTIYLEEYGKVETASVVEVTHDRSMYYSYRLQRADGTRIDRLLAEDRQTGEPDIGLPEKYDVSDRIEIVDDPLGWFEPRLVDTPDSEFPVKSTGAMLTLITLTLAAGCRTTRRPRARRT
jgi:hypothetical protein